MKSTIVKLIQFQFQPVPADPTEKFLGSNFFWIDFFSIEIFSNQNFSGSKFFQVDFFGSKFFQIKSELSKHLLSISSAPDPSPDPSPDISPDMSIAFESPGLANGSSVVSDPF